MFFLLAQIFPLLLLAAVLGAVLAYWWLKNRQMDITESYELITERLAAIEARPEPAAREDYEAGMALISSAVRSLRMPDMEPVNQRLAALEASVSGFTVPETDLAPLHGKFDGVDATLSGIASRLADIEGRMTAQDQRLAALDERLSGLGTRIADVDPRFAKLDERLTALDTAVASIANAVGELRNTDLQPVEARFGKIEETLSAFKIPEVDLGPLHSGLARLDLTIAGLDRPATDLGPVQTRLSEFESRLTQLGERLEAAQKRDMDKLSADITAVASGVSGIEMPDMGAVYQRLVSVEHAIATFTIPEPNLAPMYERLAALEETVSAIRTAMPRTPDFAPVERRIASLQEAFLTQTPTDFTPVLDAVQAIEGNLDLEAMENRLNAIEYGLAAIHHTLRSRPEPAAPKTERASRTRTAPAAIAPSPAVSATPVAPPPPPPRDLDPINDARREDDEANLLVEAAFGDADDLERINGVGPMLCELLHEVGVFYFWQVAEWSPQDVEWVDGKLQHFKGRITRDRWVDQARDLAMLPDSARRPGS
ncbi:hypothetical protein [Hyphomonas chukchiensis]|uniref:NADH dehydrogenase subunit E n=1 Tax=Hyphomonas chukchiensis TaxID=1280947 RepID=A0A062URV3_9PROT|nr:hypothetical protein [Hyphomonas chukchiensis]KCZ60986.1 hypothetical protein HY30_01215 [Hyphomonas chukchiensis]